MTFEEACSLFSDGRPDLFSEASQAVIDYCRDPKNLFGPGEVVLLARALAQSGEEIIVPDDRGPLADVPSTGGPASLTTLLCPLLLAATGVRVPQLSATGSIAGAVDTMAIIKGFRSKLSPDDYLVALRHAGIAHAEPHETVCPADRALIQLRRKSNLMPHKGLAAASLLAKKLAVPGTCASFDFRVGPTGNIGEGPAEAGAAAELFCMAAASLGINIAITITDNRSFPCSALGRLESLDLLWGTLNCKDNLTALDKEHVETCLLIAARGCALAAGNLNEADKRKEELKQLLGSGRVLQLFVKHLEAQGSSLTAFHEILDARGRQRVREIVAEHDGLWRPPDLAVAKDFVKRGQAAVDRMGKHDGRCQFGLRLLATPGQEVLAGQPVMEVRFPDGLEPPLIRGLYSGSAILGCCPSHAAI